KAQTTVAASRESDPFAAAPRSATTPLTLTKPEDSGDSKVTEPKKLSSSKVSTDRFAVPAFSAGIASRYTIDPYEDTLLTTPQGMLLHIPANSFIGKEGEAPEVQVDVAIQEMKLNEMSAHKYYRLTAQDASKLLVLKPGRHLYLELMVPREVNDQPQAVRYELLAQDLEESAMTVQNREPHLFALPLAQLRLSDLAQSRPAKVQQAIERLNDSRYEHTLIATREFRERLYYLLWLEEDITELLAIYTSNLDKPLYQLDQMVQFHLHQVKVARNQDKLEIYNVAARRFFAFSQLYQGTVLPRQVEGVQLTDTKAQYQLHKKGMPTEEASWWTALGNTAKSLPQHLQDNHPDKTAIGFQVSQTGWLCLRAIPQDAPDTMPGTTETAPALTSSHTGSR
ncbi:MAG: hypothetical protein KF690_02970, partial [Bacteroidetes bacterium]|nr:hypothetical protein [Bacteroidota bacterium]